MTNTITLTNQVLARTNWTFTQCETTVHQLLDNLGESTKDTARHDIDTADAVVTDALTHWYNTAN